MNVREALAVYCMDNMTDISADNWNKLENFNLKKK